MMFHEILESFLNRTKTRITYSSLAKRAGISRLTLYRWRQLEKNNDSKILTPRREKIIDIIKVLIREEAITGIEECNQLLSSAGISKKITPNELSNDPDINQLKWADLELADDFLRAYRQVFKESFKDWPVKVFTEPAPNSLYKKFDFESMYVDLRLSKDENAPSGVGQQFTARDVKNARSNSVIIILGRMGAGKSTLMKKIFRDLIRDNQTVPFFLDLAALPEKWPEKEDKIPRLVSFLKDDITKHKDLKKWVNNLHAFLDKQSELKKILLLDGLNDIGGISKSREFCDIVDEFIDEYQMRVVISSRPIIMRTLPGRLNNRIYRTICPLRWPEITRFATSFFQYQENQQALNDFLRNLSDVHGLAKFAARPFYLSMLLCLCNEGFPNTPHRLYRIILNNVILRSRQNSMGKWWVPVHVAEQERVLAKIAFDLQESINDQENTSSYDGIIKKALPKHWELEEKDGFFHWLKYHSGLFDTHEFIGSEPMEFLVAWHLYHTYTHGVTDLYDKLKPIVDKLKSIEDSSNEIEAARDKKEIEDFFALWNRMISEDGKTNLTLENTIKHFIEKDTYQQFEYLVEKPPWHGVLTLWSAMIDEGTPSNLEKIIERFLKRTDQSGVKGVAFAGIVYAEGFGDSKTPDSKDQFSYWVEIFIGNSLVNLDDSAERCLRSWVNSQKDDRKKELLRFINKIFGEELELLQGLQYPRLRKILNLIGFEAASHHFPELGLYAIKNINERIPEMWGPSFSESQSLDYRDNASKYHEIISRTKSLVGACPIWPTEPLSIGLLHLWPDRERMILSMNLQLALDCGATEGELDNITNCFRPEEIKDSHVIRDDLKEELTGVLKQELRRTKNKPKEFEEKLAEQLSEYLVRYWLLFFINDDKIIDKDKFIDLMKNLVRYWGHDIDHYYFPLKLKSPMPKTLPEYLIRYVSKFLDIDCLKDNFEKHNISEKLFDFVRIGISSMGRAVPIVLMAAQDFRKLEHEIDKPADRIKMRLLWRACRLKIGYDFDEKLFDEEIEQSKLLLPEFWVLFAKHIVGRLTIEEEGTLRSIVENPTPEQLEGDGYLCSAIKIIIRGDLVSKDGKKISIDDILKRNSWDYLPIMKRAA